MKNLTIIIPFFLNSNEIKKTLSKVKTSASYDLLLINDCYDDEKYDGFINNERNIGKFWSIINSLNVIETKYFIAIDPDDIQKDGINWEKIENFVDKLKTYNEEYDYIINSFNMVEPGAKEEYKNSNEQKFVFNANTIYSTKNVRDFCELMSIDSLIDEHYPLTYFDDTLLLFMSYGNGKTINMDFPFYTYYQLIGVTKNIDSRKSEIYKAKSMLNHIKKYMNFENIGDERILVRKKRIEEIEV